MLNFVLLIFILVAPTAYLLLIIFNIKKYLLDSKLLIVFFAIFTMVFLNKLLFFHQTLAAQDFNNIQITFIHFFRESVIEYGQPPLWNSKVNGGFDAFSNPLSVYFSPLNFLYLISPDPYASAAVFLYFQIFLISLFSFVMFRGFGFSKNVSFFGAVVLTFNGFLCSRLSPGVGTEYLYSFKWVPLIIYYSYQAVKFQKRDAFIILALPLGFVFEGNLNLAVSAWILWGISVLVFTEKWTRFLFAKLIAVIFMALGIYAVKLLPGMELALKGFGRISEISGGWRIDRIDLHELAGYFIPLSHDFRNAIFTTGIIALPFILLGLFRIKKNRLSIFTLGLLLIGSILNTHNLLSDLFFTLPLMNRLTIVPAFTIFLIIPIGLWAAEGMEVISKYKYGVLLLSGAYFLEILLGFSIFGPKTYSFNFAKMDPKEVYQIQHLKDIREKYNGLYILNGHSSIYLYPYALELLNLHTLNSFNYFFSETTDTKLLSSGSFENLPKYSDYVISSSPLITPFLQQVGEIDTGGLAEKFQSYAIQEKKYDYYKLQGELNWSEKLYVYTGNEPKVVSVKNLSNDPVHITFSIKSENIKSPDGLVATSLAYSPWWKVSNGVNIEKDEYGYVKLRGVLPGEKVDFIYVNWFIYGGLAVSLSSFLIITVLQMSSLRGKNDPSTL